MLRETGPRTVSDLEVSIPSGGIILFPLVFAQYGRLSDIELFPSRLAGLSYFHLAALFTLFLAVPGFHPVWRDYPISTLDFVEKATGKFVKVSIPSGGIILFPLGDGHDVFAEGTVSFHPVWRDYPISTLMYAKVDFSRIEGFHPVWRDYPISTAPRNDAPLGNLGFPSRLAGLSYFHRAPRIGESPAEPLRLGFHPVWRDYPISTGSCFSERACSAPSRFHPVWRDYPIST